MVRSFHLSNDNTLPGQVIETTQQQPLQNQAKYCQLLNVVNGRAQKQSSRPSAASTKPFHLLNAINGRAQEGEKQHAARTSHQDHQQPLQNHFIFSTPSTDELKRGRRETREVKRGASRV
jgi:hypothetical protein